jgi:dipeptidase
LAHTDDSGGGTQDVRVTKVPAADHAPGAMRPIFGGYNPYPRIVSEDRGPNYQPIDGQVLSVPIGFVAQVPHTFGYWDTDYGVMNEKSLAFAESTCGSRTAGWPVSSPGGFGLWGIDELTRVALERCATARCAIALMGALAEESGFFSADSGLAAAPGYDDTAECLGIADHTGEVWIFNILTGPGGKGAVWAAQRLADEDATIVANHMSIRGVDLNDDGNFMASKGIVEVAKQEGWWVPDSTGKGDLDFVATFGQREDATNAAAPTSIGILYSGRRVWRFYNLVAPSLPFDPYVGYLVEKPTYPFSVTPDRTMDVQAVFSVLRDYFQGTEFDMSKGLAAGPWGSPARFSIGKQTHDDFGGKGNFERAIAIWRCTLSFVNVIRPDQPVELAHFWYGHGTTYNTAYSPIYASQDTLPTSYTNVLQSVYDPNAAWWVFQFLNNWANLHFNCINPEILAASSGLESATMADQITTETAAIEQIHAGQAREAVQALEQWSNTRLTSAVEAWKALTHTLIAKYHDNYETFGESTITTSLGYDESWLENVGFLAWPGSTYTPPAALEGAAAARPPLATVGVSAGTVVFLMVCTAVISSLLTIRSKGFTLPRDAPYGLVADETSRIAIELRGAPKAKFESLA